MMPRRFISATVFLPSAERPLCIGSRGPDESASWLLRLWTSVM